MNSVIGVRTDIILRKFTAELPVPFEVAEGDVRIDAVVIEADGGPRTARSRASRRSSERLRSGSRRPRSFVHVAAGLCGSRQPLRAAA